MSDWASARAAMQFRMSPTGGIPSSSRSAPDEPPSSATVTIAVMLLVCSFIPRNSAERPVPPPRAPTLGALADQVGAAQGQQQEAAEDDEEPALDADPRGQPAAQVHPRSSSRWKTWTGPRPDARSQAASSSAKTIERCWPPVHPMAPLK